MKVLDLFDDFDGSNNRHADYEWRQSVQSPPANLHSALKGFWLMKDGKKLSGPFKTYDKAATFKANRKDKIPVDAIIKEL